MSLYHTVLTSDKADKDKIKEDLSAIKTDQSKFKHIFW